jgi:hypothetical protein
MSPQRRRRLMAAFSLLLMSAIMIIHLTFAYDQIITPGESLVLISLLWMFAISHVLAILNL